MIPADTSFWTWWLPVGLTYLLIGFVIWLGASVGAGDQPKDSFWRVTLATYAAFWIVWPISTVVLIIWLVGFGAVAMTLDAWHTRNGDSS